MLVGREVECARIDGLLEASRRGRTGTLVLVGEPGIGKTALLEHTIARAVGMRPLRIAGVEAESRLPFSGLHALLLPLLDLLDRVEPPQRRALEIALALAEGDEPDVLAVNAGTLWVLAEAAGTRPLLLVVDDAQWVDRPSANALAFALRRLEVEDIACVVAVRTGETSAFESGFERLELQSLTTAAARQVLARRAEAVPLAAVDRMLELAAGNPLALLELPAALAAAEVDGAVAAPERIRRAFAARLDSLPSDAARGLLLAAAEPDTRAARTAAARLGIGRDALGPAEAAGLVRVEVDGIAFRHPIVRSLAYSSADAAARREAHAALADALTEDSDRDRRAWHLSAAAIEPDEKLAAMLEQTAERAEARGGHGAAARALERAARLSPENDAAARRLTRAARLSFWAGEADRGVELAEEALRRTSDPNLRVHALLEGHSIQEAQRGYDPATLEAITHADELDPDTATRLLLSLLSVRGAAFDAAGELELAERLEEVARRAGPWWSPRGLAVAATGYLAAGDGARFDRLLEEMKHDAAAVANVALDVIWAERYELARSTLVLSLQEGRRAGNRIRIIWNQACLAHLELRLGRLREAQAASAESITSADARGMHLYSGVARGAQAGVLAWRGDENGCRAVAAEALADATESGATSDVLFVRGVLGRLALGLGKHHEVVDHLRPAERTWEASTQVEPSSVAFMPDLVEAQLHLGNDSEARASLERFRHAAERTQRRWALAAVARCDGMLAGPNDYAAPFERSLALLESSPLTLDRARTQLAYGERLRRAGKRRDARLHLRVAHEAFSSVDAGPWADRAAAELRATGETVGPRTPDRRGRLSPQELQIAQLVRDGKTNKEIAAQLYLSPKTIEYHLGNAYRKLAIHSRAELTRILVEN